MGTVNYPTDLDKLTHGWRWWKIRDDKLVSPLAQYPITLGRDGLIRGAYFVPKRWHMESTYRFLHDRGGCPLALTFGQVQGPFERDPQMPRIGSMKASVYQADCIVTEFVANLSANYEIPAYRCTAITEEILHAIESRHTK